MTDPSVFDNVEKLTAIAATVPLQKLMDTIDYLAKVEAHAEALVSITDVIAQSDRRRAATRMHVEAGVLRAILTGVLNERLVAPTEQILGFEALSKLLG